VNVPFLVAAALALVGAAVHGGAGEALVVRKLAANVLPPSPFGGGAATKLMIRATWHMTTVAFAVLGLALAACAGSDAGATCKGVGRLAGLSFSGFALIAVGGAIARSPRSLVRHPAPVLFSTVAALAWWGSA
jgi:hypothetical protein